MLNSPDIDILLLSVWERGRERERGREMERERESQRDRARDTQ